MCKGVKVTTIGVLAIQGAVEEHVKAIEKVGMRAREIRLPEEIDYDELDGLILPDLPMFEYMEVHKPTFEKHGLLNIFLITPQTSDARIREIDQNSSGFIYMVSSASTTGAKTGISDEQEAYFARVKAMNLKNPTLIGFGISNKETFDKACKNANGAIIGSAFIKAISQDGEMTENNNEFIRSVKG